ncbi:PAAR domain-containing protein [Halodesulfovibrio sp. MK-HDV]
MTSLIHPNTDVPLRQVSGTVFFDGKPAARSSDSVNCGGALVGGGTVTIG